MDNASALVSDSRLLLDAGSGGRARSLVVLAQEELGKALWIYEAFQLDWNSGSEEPRECEELTRNGRNHVEKYLAAFVFGDRLAAFWGDYSGFALAPGDSWEDRRQREASAARQAAKQANLDKQAGFYVDRADDGVISNPQDRAAGTIDEELRTAAQVVEMLLIQDHTRMKHDAATEYDSTHAQQFRLLPISHPEDWAAAPEEFKAEVAEG